jgi:Tol biopolymer transport system component
MLGRGGMGEVYRARDTKLGRQVALKILPREFAVDADRLARFEREARMLAALNHPNIGAIYAVEQVDNSPVLILELVPGETLAERLARAEDQHPEARADSRASRGLAIREALGIGRQIAEALDAAHERGIVHRDLKPANVKITPDGVVKVLDFGLAKTAVGLDADVTQSAGKTIEATRAGMLLGTAAYMSPEQARGLTVDKRTDIWAFACVLYEMLTGRSPFAGATTSDTIAAILHQQPDWAVLPPDTPVAVRHLLSQCLAKNPKYRLRDIGDARLDIDLALAETDRGTVTGPIVRPPPRRSVWRFVAAPALALALAAGAIIAARYVRQPATPLAPEMRLEITPPPRSLPFEFALSPDGRHIVFVASPDGPQRLWLRSLNKTDTQPLPGTDGADYPFWSADSRSIGFFASGKLYRIDVSGGPPEPLAEAPLGRGGTWNANQVIVFSPAGGPLMKIPASGGEPVAVTRLDPPAQTGHLSPHFLPDGRHFLFYAAGSPLQAGVYLGSLDRGIIRRLTPADTAAMYIAPDLVVFARQGALVARHLDHTRGELTGDEVVIADSVSADVGFHLGGFSASVVGCIAYQSPRALPVELSSFDRTGKSLGVVLGEHEASNHLANPEVSPDGQRVAVTRAVQNNVDVWVKDLAGGGLTRFTTDTASDAFPLWSPDGTKIAFSSNRAGVAYLYVKPSDGAGAEDVLLDTQAFPQDWSKNGRFLLYGNVDPKTGRDIWVVDLTAHPRKPRIVVNTPFEERNGQFSPDGRWIAFETNASGRFEVVVQAFPAAGAIQPVSRAGGTQPRWRADGREIYFLAPAGKLMAASVVAHENPSRIQTGTPIALFPTQIGEGGATVFKAQYALDPGGRFLIAQPGAETAVFPITLILNWKPATR